MRPPAGRKGINSALSTAPVNNSLLETFVPSPWAIGKLFCPPACCLPGPTSQSPDKGHLTLLLVPGYTCTVEGAGGRGRWGGAGSGQWPQADSIPWEEAPEVWAPNWEVCDLSHQDSAASFLGFVASNLERAILNTYSRECQWGSQTLSRGLVKALSG